MIIDTTTFSPMFGGAGTPQSMAFDDATSDLNTKHSISKIEFNAGWVVDGLKVTYNNDRQIVHGTFNPSNVGDKVVNIADDEYISGVEGEHGRHNGQYDYGDCIQKIRFIITNSKTKAERQTEYFGKAEYLKTPEPFSWEGHLFAFAGRADNKLPQVGLKGLSFGQCTGKVALAESFPYGGDRSSSLMGQAYDDLKTYGTQINFLRPIKSLGIWSGQLIDGIEVTYNLSNGSTATLMHGAKGGSKTEIQLLPTENIVEVNGICGIAAPLTDWKIQCLLLGFKILNSANGCVRDTMTFGAPNNNYVPESRKDICVRGQLAGFSGTANNNLSMAGLNTIVFHTLCPLQEDA
ncbi:hypothetical protein FRC09_005927 [Ceratobasidium sp. 395]|nr:hypothetical protein FRC09_005927 [Ceratobasidium sp. 395]